MSQENVHPGYEQDQFVDVPIAPPMTTLLSIDEQPEPNLTPYDS